MDGAAAQPARLAEVAQLAERLGYDSLWAPDHLLIPDRVDSVYRGEPGGRFPFDPEHPWLEPLTSLSWVARSAPSLRLCTGILVLPQRDWLVVAKQAATLDHLSGGRLVLGIGVGWMAEEFRILGKSFQDRVARTKEAVSTMRRLWAGGDLEGARMYPLPVRGRIPIVWGGYTRAARRCVAEFGDGWLSADRTPDELRAGVAELRRLAGSAGRDPSTLAVIAKPGLGFPVTRESVQEFAAAGAGELVIDPPHRDGSGAAGEEMRRVARDCGLAPRAVIEQRS